MASPNMAEYINRHIRTAGWHAAQMRAGVEIQTKGVPDDFVTQADKEVDKMISAALCAVLPHCRDLCDNCDHRDGLITEESVANLSPEAARAVVMRRRVWYLDAIDGTDNYVKEDGQYSVLLGLVVGGEPVYGWIYAPARDELYFAGPPSETSESFGYAGLWRKRGSRQPEKVTDKSFPGSKVPPASLRVIMGSRDRRDNPQVIERIKADEWVLVGSLGLKVIAIINGAADVYIHASCKLNFWDTAAPVAMAEAAGLSVCDFNGNPLSFKLQPGEHATDMFRHCQTVLIGTPGGVAAVRNRLAVPGTP
jgi:3'-phosphoadenosine 5'-phosphosulfate (PAPS) 3'-phosphatase